MVYQSTSYPCGPERRRRRRCSLFSIAERQSSRREIPLFWLFHNGNSGRRLKVEQRFRQGKVFLPISEAVFQFYSPRLQDANVRQFPALGVDFQKHLVELLVNGGYRTAAILFGGAVWLRLLAPRKAAQYKVALRSGIFCAQIEALAELRELRLARQQGKGCTPIRALLH